jgi:hypothetical protein
MGIPKSARGRLDARHGRGSAVGRSKSRRRSGRPCSSPYRDQSETITSLLSQYLTNNLCLAHPHGTDINRHIPEGKHAPRSSSAASPTAPRTFWTCQAGKLSSLARTSSRGAIQLLLLLIRAGKLSPEPMLVKLLLIVRETSWAWMRGEASLAW